MKVREIMTRDVVTVGPAASIHEAARLMAEHAVSGLPVVDADRRLVGIISDGDVVIRPRPREPRPWWHRFFADAEALAREYRRAVGVTVGEAMTTPAVSVSPDLDASLAAVILDRHRFRRLPVVEGDRLVGVVSRADLIRAFGATAGAPAAPWPDAVLVAAMRRRLAQEPWVSDRRLSVQARGGVLRLSGTVASLAEKEALEAMARSIEGCRGLDSRLELAPSRAARRRQRPPG